MSGDVVKSGATYNITSLQLYNIAGDEVDGLDLDGFSAAYNDGLWRSQAFERFYRLLCLVVLPKSIGSMYVHSEGT